ncbi:hypothetical protein SNS2_3699 [Streptomyces netropsis]|uniref:Uncharacterized protein n=1 Tax=Streptomyces syringium TaxID=76729 RepID=A0ABS4Y8F5_9ACTN|nr:hypothetical protein [Streptomyces syringium]MBP2405074.1 hypothetical protein [Streptomyces syringium]SPE58059.1 hypothetical protein SNS2_3699 [Streptomyces netropsis]
MSEGRAALTETCSIITKEMVAMGRKDDQQQEPDDDDRAWNPDDDFGRPSDPTDPSTADGDAPHRR